MPYADTTARCAQIDCDGVACGFEGRHRAGDLRSWVSLAMAQQIQGRWTEGQGNQWTTTLRLRPRKLMPRKLPVESRCRRRISVQNFKPPEIRQSSLNHRPLKTGLEHHLGTGIRFQTVSLKTSVSNKPPPPPCAAAPRPSAPCRHNSGRKSANPSNLRELRLSSRSS